MTTNESDDISRNHLPRWLPDLEVFFLEADWSKGPFVSMCTSIEDTFEMRRWRKQEQKKTNSPRKSQQIFPLPRKSLRVLSSMTGVTAFRQARWRPGETASGSSWNALSRNMQTSDKFTEPRGPQDTMSPRQTDSLLPCQAPFWMVSHHRFIVSHLWWLLLHGVKYYYVVRALHCKRTKTREFHLMLCGKAANKQVQ